MAFTFTLTQAHATAIGNPAVPTLGSAVTAGNILLCAANERSGIAHANFVDPSGWTKLGGYDNEISDGNARMAMAAWIKIATGSEGTQPASIDNGTANNIRALVLELTPSAAIATAVKEVEAANGSGTGSTSPLTIGPTGSAVGTDYLVVQFGGWRNGLGEITGVTWDNSPDDDDFVDGGGNGLSLAWGFFDSTASGTYDVDMSYTESNGSNEHAGLLFVIAVAAGGGGGGISVPVAYHHRMRNF